MPYKKKIARKSKTVISENLMSYLLTGESKEADAEVFRLSGSQDRLRAVWDACKAEIMRDWIKNDPCSRPWPWWEFDAPQEPVKCWTDMDIEKAQRKRLGGKGTPSFQVLSCGLDFSHGIPTSWIDEWEVAYYTGKGKDVHGKRIGTEFKKSNFAGVAYDENDPPTFESEAVYLERHGFLSDKEKAYLLKHKSLLKPEKVEYDDEED